jgi:hypothetical protein
MTLSKKPAGTTWEFDSDYAAIPPEIQEEALRLIGNVFEHPFDFGYAYSGHQLPVRWVDLGQGRGGLFWQPSPLIFLRIVNMAQVDESTPSQ